MLKYISLLSFLVVVMLFVGCKEAAKPPQAEIVSAPEQLDETASDHIRKSLAFAASNEGTIGDSIFLFKPELVKELYEKNDYAPVWSSTEQWKPLADSLFEFIDHAKWWGLFPEDYNGPRLQMIRDRFTRDSLSRTDKLDAALWSRADLMLTDAFMRIVKDLKLGRLPNDSITLRKDSVLDDDFYEQQLNILLKAGSVTKVIRYLEPRHEGYLLLKAAIPAFLENADYTEYTFVPAYKQDSINFKTLLAQRLTEGGYMVADSTGTGNDSIRMASAIKKFQKEKGITVDGKAGETTLRLLNTNDRERFVRIALTLDKFKLLPEKMPAKYIWVNLPSFFMKLKSGDSVKLSSRIICGKPKTRTPLLNSAVSEIITYPQWTVPSSIIEKEILPAVKKDPGYLAKKGFSLVDKDGNEVDPFTVDWSKYKKGIPYKVVQGSGDDNALGILKFNFPNKYAVYLHDTNQRHLFKQSMRSLSHGCVRVQDWEKLAYYMLRNDDSLVHKVRLPEEDSLAAWLLRKEKHGIPIKKRVPLFIRYLTCEATADSLLFYDDIYGEDKRLQLTYFKGK